MLKGRCKSKTQRGGGQRGLEERDQRYKIQWMHFDSISGEVEMVEFKYRYMGGGDEEMTTGKGFMDKYFSVYHKGKSIGLRL